MESLNPSLRLIIQVREFLDRGDSIRACLREFARTDASPFANELGTWLFHRENGRPYVVSEKRTMAEKFLFRLIDRGLNGEPIAGPLKELQDEVVEQCELQIEEFIALLPLKSLIPLLIFIFPAFMMLLLGPLAESLLTQLR